MASTSLRSDGCSYQEKMRVSIGPGAYALNRPANDCGAACGRDVPADPFMRWQAWGPGFCTPGSTVDDGSDLLGITRKASMCTKNQYLPGANVRKPVCAAPERSESETCRRPTEPTRLSNPPCTLRGTGWNRWEWLCYDPQDKAIMPFEHNVAYRTVVKDNHKPCIPAPQEATNVVSGERLSNKVQVSEAFQNWSAVSETASGPGPWAPSASAAGVDGVGAWAPSPTWASCDKLKALGA